MQQFQYFRAVQQGDVLLECWEAGYLLDQLEGRDGGQREVSIVALGQCFLEQHGPQFLGVGEEHGLLAVLDVGDAVVDADPLAYPLGVQ